MLLQIQHNPTIAWHSIPSKPMKCPPVLRGLSTYFIPSGKLLQFAIDSILNMFIDKRAINGPFSIVMLVYKKGYLVVHPTNRKWVS